MRFSIKSRVESLIKRDRILAAIHKLQRFTKNKEDHQLTYNTLNELESRFKQIDKEFKNKTIDYATYDREKSKIRSSVLDINNEIEDLKETRDKKFIWTWTWAILTGLLIPVLGIFIPYMMEDKSSCPDFDNSSCKLLVFDFNQPDNINNIADEINTVLQNDDHYQSLLTSRKYQGTESAAPDVVEDKVESCDADFAIYGAAVNVSDGISLRLNPYPEKPQLASYVDEVRDTIQSFFSTQSFIANDEIQLMLNLLVCEECGCEVDETAIMNMAKGMDPEEQENLLSLLASYQYNRKEYDSSERTLTSMIRSSIGGIKLFAFRGKVRDDQQKYEPAFQDYSYYLEEKPANHNVRLKRFTSVYNMVKTTGWQPRYASFIDIAAEDLRLLKGNISNDQYRLAQQRLEELLRIKDAHLSPGGPTGPTIPETQEKCDFTFNIKYEGQGVKRARINIMGLLEELTDNNGTFTLRDVGCEEVLNRKLVVTKDGFIPYEAEINNEFFNIVLEPIPEEAAMCIFSGVVVNEREEAIVSASVQVDGLPRTRTDGNGRFKFRAEPCEIMKGKGLTIVANGYETHQSEIRDMEVLVLMQSEIISDPNPDLCSFNGYIMDVTGKPISGAVVSIFGIPNISTNSRGYFKSKEVECNALPGLKYTITAEGYEQISEIITEGQYKVEHALKRETASYKIAGRITNVITNQALAGVTIILDQEPIGQSGRGGSFTFNTLHQGRNTTKVIEFQKDGFHSKSSRINIDGAENLSIAMTPSRISGKVLGNGKPIPGASIKIKGLRTTATNRSGQYAFNIPDGFTFPESFKVGKSGYQSATIPMAKYKSITLIPLRKDILNVVVTKEAYNDQSRKWEYVPAQGASIIIDREVMGKTGKDGKLAINMTGRLNQTVTLNIEGVDQISRPRLPMKVTFTKNGQVVNISHYVLK